jgi:AraC family transcriptional regulator
MTLFTDVWRGESSLSQGRFVDCSFFSGAINLFPAGLIPAWRSSTPAKAIVCALDPMFVKEVGSELDSPAVTEFRLATDLRDPAMQGIIKLLAVEAESGGLSGSLYTDHLAHALALRFLNLSGSMRLAIPSPFGKLPNRVLQRVLDRMKADLAADLDLNTLASESGYSRSHFLRTFRAATGCSPHQWLTRLRIEHAKTMLRENSLSMVHIALACGFSSHGHFSNKFRRIVGVTPSEYRRGYVPKL